MANPFPPFGQLTSQSWQSWQQQVSPTALLDPTGTIFEAALASAKDLFADRVRLALKAKLAGIAPTDALAQIGIERGILQNLGETDTAYATRLLRAWDVWPWAGSARGVLRALFDAGYPNTAVVQQLGTLFTLDASQNLVATASPRWTFDSQAPLVVPTVWAASTTYAASKIVVPSPPNGFLYDSAGGGTSGVAQPTFPTTVGATVGDNSVTWCCRGRDFWSRFAVVFFTPFPASWAGVPPGYASAEVTRIRNLINQWKSAHSTCVQAVAITTGRVLGFPAPLRTLGASNGTLGGATTTVWTPI